MVPNLGYVSVVQEDYHAAESMNPIISISFYRRLESQVPVKTWTSGESVIVLEMAVCCDGSATAVFIRNMRISEDLLKGKESSCIQRFGSSGKSILPKSHSAEPNEAGACSVPGDRMSALLESCVPDKLEVLGLPFDELGPITRLASRCSSPKIMVYRRFGALP